MVNGVTVCAVSLKTDTLCMESIYQNLISTNNWFIDLLMAIMLLII